MIITRCEECHGQGPVWTDDWAHFVEWRDRHPALTSDWEDDLVEWFFLVVLDYTEVPPMRCMSCQSAPV